MYLEEITLKNITVYSTTTCPYCRMLVEWLRKEDIAFTEYKVDQNPIAAQNMVRLSGQMGVPFTTIEDGDTVDTVLGFDVPKLKNLLQGAK